MNEEISNVVIEIIDEHFKIGELSLEQIPEELTKTEIGNISDPIGQIAGWFWNNIKPAIEAVGTFIWSKLITIRDTYLSPIFDKIISVGKAISEVIKPLLDRLSSTLLSVYDYVKRIPSNIGDIFGFIRDGITRIGTDIISIGRYLLEIVGRVREIPTAIINLGKEIYNRLTDFGTRISNLFSDFAKRITDAFSILRERLTDMTKRITEGFSNFYTYLKEGFTNIIEKVTNSLKETYDYLKGSLTKIIETMSSSFQKVYDTFKDLGKYITDGLKKTYDFLSGIGKDLGSFFSTAISQLKSFGGMLWDAVKSLRDWLEKGIKAITSGIVTFSTEIMTFLKKIPNIFKDLWNWLAEQWGKFRQGLGEWWHAASEWWSQRIYDIQNSMGRISTAFMGFINPLITISNLFKPLAEAITNGFKRLPEFINKIIDFFTPIGEFILYPGERIKVLGEKVIAGITWVGEKIVDGAEWLFSKIASGAMKLGNMIISGLKEIGALFIEFIMKAFSGWMQAFTAPVKLFESILKEIIEPMFKGTVKKIGEICEANVKDIATEKGQYGVIEVNLPTWLEGLFGGIETLGTLLVGFFTTQILARYIQWTIKGLAKTFPKISPALKAILRPFGIGAQSDFNIDIAIPAALIEMGDEVRDWQIELYRGLVYGLSIWMWQPLSRIITSHMRNILPIQLPETGLLIEATRRAMPSEKFKERYDVFRYYSALYGFSDNITAWILEPEDKSNVPITDRFKVVRKLPISLMYDLPSMSDFARMMVHDIFYSIEDFTKAMQLRGVNKDTAYMYYLLHFRYPTPENLWNFYCRSKAGLLWYKPTITKIPEVEAGIGKPPVAPADLNKKENVVISAIENYMKWHDYAPFSWLDGFTSDRWLMMDLMADIPTRIDVRWMYKWGIADDEYVKNIVIARGLHPNYVDDVATAEMMNALTEERSYARTGVTNVYTAGYLTYENADKILQNLTTIKMLGVDRPIKFLEGERKLILLRSLYDRAYKVIDSGWDILVRGYYENAWDKDKVIAELKKIIENVNKSLGLNLSLDESFIQSWLSSYDYRYDLEVIERIRRWMWTFVRRVGDLAQAGKNVDKLIEDYAKEASLTEKEKELIKEFVDLFKETYLVELKTSAILGKLRRGEITREQAEAQLKEIIDYPEIIDALIERDLREITREYIISLSSLLSYATIIAIPEDFIAKRLEALRVPKPDADIIMQVFKVKPIKDELAIAVREVLDDFENGYRTEEETVKALTALMKKPEEIAILITAGKIEKDAKKKKLKVDAILNKIKRGALPLDKAKEELLALIKDAELVDALIEAKAKIRTVSTDKLISMMEYIPIDTKKLKEKMDAEGVPPDEQALYMSYSVGTEIAEEVHSIKTELVNDYVDGVISEAELKKALDDLATLGGWVKENLGVDWLILSPTERTLIINLAKLRRARKEAKAKR